MKELVLAEAILRCGLDMGLFLHTRNRNIVGTTRRDIKSEARSCEVGIDLGIGHGKWLMLLSPICMIMT